MKVLNFGGLPGNYTQLKNASVVVLPVPYDGTSTWIKGADRGPEAILEASANMELYDIGTGSEMYTRGIHTAAPLEEHHSPGEMVKSVEQSVSRYLKDGKFVVTLGGEHSVSIGSIYAHAAAFPGLTVLQIDAHADLREEYEGSRFNHACVMARTRETCHFVQAGIRSMDISEKAFIRKKNLFTAGKIRKTKNWQKKVVGRLKQNVYITLDLDAFDPSIMPSTGTPEPGGLGWYETMELIQMVIKNRNLVGFDVVELCPNSSNKAPDFLAAKLIYQTLSFKFSENRKR